MILTVTLNASVDKLYLLEKATLHTVMRVREVQNSAGGKGMNVARVAARLGEPVTAMGFVGGHTGRYFESLITQPSIQKAFTHVEAEMRNCVNCWDLSTGRSTEYLEPGAPVTAEEVERFLTDFAQRMPAADAVTISGSVPRGVPEDLYAVLVRLCHAAGKPVLLDASGACLQSAVKAGPTFVKPNVDEVAQLIGFSPQAGEERIRAVQALHDGGVSTAALSLGAEGVLVACSGGVYRGAPPPIQPRNTVGCGDSMVAAFAVGMVRAMPVQEQIRLAVAVSAAAALALGTGDFDERDLASILPKVHVERVQ